MTGVYTVERDESPVDPDYPERVWAVALDGVLMRGRYASKSAAGRQRARNERDASSRLDDVPGAL